MRYLVATFICVASLSACKTVESAPSSAKDAANQPSAPTFADAKLLAVGAGNDAELRKQYTGVIDGDEVPCVIQATWKSDGASLELVGSAGLPSELTRIFLHLVRDPRAVAWSWQRVKTHDDFD